MEVLSQRLVLHRVPADADTQTQPPIAEDVNCSGLLCHECGLALRQDDDGGYKLDAARDGCKEAVKYEWLVEGVGMTICTAPSRPGFSVRTEHVIEHDNVVVAHLFSGLGVGSHASGVTSQSLSVGIPLLASSVHDLSFGLGWRIVYYTR